MPNWAYTNLKLFSKNKKTIESIKQEFDDAENNCLEEFKGSNSWCQKIDDNKWIDTSIIGVCCHLLGLDYESTDNYITKKNYGNARGCVCSSYDKIIPCVETTTDGKETEYYLFGVELESAWDIPNALFSLIIEKYPDVELAFRCEESGNGVYEYYDEKGYFYGSEVIVDTDFPEFTDEYATFNDTVSALDYINETLNTHYSSLDEAQRDLNDNHSNNNEIYISIHEYEQIHSF